MYRTVAIHSCVCSDTASTACLCVHSPVCQRSQEGRGVQYLQPGFMAVDIPILILHTCSQLHCTYIQSVYTELDWVPIFLCPLHSPHDFGFGQLSFSCCVWWHHIITFYCAKVIWLMLLNVPPWPPQLFNPVSQCPSPCECAILLRMSCVWGCNVHIYVCPQMLNNVVHAVTMEPCIAIWSSSEKRDGCEYHWDVHSIRASASGVGNLVFCCYCHILYSYSQDDLVTGLISSAVCNHPSLKELTTGYVRSPSLVNGAVEGIVRKAGVKKLVIKDDFPGEL